MLFAKDTRFAGRFVVLSFIEEGGMGAVYRVRDEKTGRERALKVLKLQFAANEDFRRRFRAEASASGRFESRHVVDVIDTGIDDETGVPWLAMELLHGETLDHRIERLGKLSLPDAARVFRQLRDALGKAHAAGVLHLDLKPSNIFLLEGDPGDPPIVKVLDFGIARVMDAGRTHATATMMAGTFAWMAPEQAEAGARLNPAADVWALGLIAFLVLTGRQYWLACNDPTSVNQRKLTCESWFDPIVPPSERVRALGLTASLPAGFDGWFARCVVRAVSERFDDADVCLGTLVTLVDAPSALPSPAAPIEPAVVAASATPTTPLAHAPSPVTLPVEIAPTVLVDPPDLTPEAAARARVEATPSADVPPAPDGPSNEPVSHALDAAPVDEAPVRRASVLRVAVGVGAAVMGAVLLWGVWPSAPREPVGDAGDAAPVEAVVIPSVPDVAPVEPPLDCPNGTVGLRGGTLEIADGTTSPRQRVGPFCIDRTEVTVEDYAACVGHGCTAPVAYNARTNFACNWQAPERAQHPINCVSAGQAAADCAFRGGALPTEAQWEWAARGASRRSYPWGDAVPTPTRTNLCGAECAAAMIIHGWSQREGIYGWTDPFPTTAPVGSLAEGATPEGLLDMAGNVLEWTRSDYVPPRGQDAGAQGHEPLRVLRGGSWRTDRSTSAMSDVRFSFASTGTPVEAGFRCVYAPR